MLTVLLTVIISYLAALAYGYRRRWKLAEALSEDKKRRLSRSHIPRDEKGRFMNMTDSKGRKC